MLYVQSVLCVDYSLESPLPSLQSLSSYDRPISTAHKANLYNPETFDKQTPLLSIYRCTDACNNYYYHYLHSFPLDTFHIASKPLFTFFMCAGMLFSTTTTLLPPNTHIHTCLFISSEIDLQKDTRRAS